MSEAPEVAQTSPPAGRGGEPPGEGHAGAHLAGITRAGGRTGWEGRRCWLSKGRGLTDT